jgi:hypothetical protein
VLRQCAELAAVDVSNPRYKWLTRFAAPVVTVGDRSFDLWDARYEIVRRIVEYPESRWWAWAPDRGEITSAAQAKICVKSAVAKWEEVAHQTGHIVV